MNWYWHDAYERKNREKEIHVHKKKLSRRRSWRLKMMLRQPWSTLTLFTILNMQSFRILKTSLFHILSPSFIQTRNNKHLDLYLRDIFMLINCKIWNWMRIITSNRLLSALLCSTLPLTHSMFSPESEHQISIKIWITNWGSFLIVD